jgi:outer membrane protein assembly factor BamB
MNDLHVFLGVRCSVVCVDATTGETVWRQELSAGFGEGFVSLALNPKSVFAHTRGKLYCLDRVTGAVRWTNELRGLGFGTAFVCTDSSPMHYVDALLKKEANRSSGG